ncbi:MULTISPECIES: DUF732 domain-containing protein [unclassified Knoellia]|uniref:DUF732 domain-containing protein n=1 Tax=Knoellia altitudinis TaxID=3404795 RepID=UPI0036097A5D
MLTLRKPVTLLCGAALALTLSACGSESPDTSGSTPTPSTTSAPTPSSSPTPTPSNSGIVPANTWASVFKKAVPPLASKSDEAVATAGQKVCTDFEAAPTDATADTILKGLESSLGLDRTQAQIFASGAITHFCTPQADAWTKASLG